MISIIITSFKEPKTIGKAIESFTSQELPKNYELIVAAPDKETQEVVEQYQKKNKNIQLFKDPGKGKSYAINLLLPKLKGEIIILSDGDVYVSDNSVKEILNLFEDKEVGCVSGRPVSLNIRKNIFGYWSHLLCDAAHELREKRNERNQFLECSGYLWAFRNKIIRKFPIDIAEDTIVPIMFYIKDYNIKYSPKAKVYIKYPTNLRDFLRQKRRAAGSHDNIGKYINSKEIPQMKTFFNEVAGGTNLFFYPNNFKELMWTFLIFPFRLYIWANLFFNSKIRKRKYTDAWQRIESTKQ
ncbi:glycosyltransferase [Nanoarchaeota archaeon]